MQTLKQMQVPSAIIGPALLAWYKLIHYQIPDPGPVEVGSEEAAKLAREVVQAVVAYLPSEEQARITSGGHAAPEHATPRDGSGFRGAGQVEVYSHRVGGAPGCCVGIGGRLVCVRVAQ